MNELKPCLIDRNKIPFKELWQEANCFADDIVCAVGTDFMLKIAEAERKFICDLLNSLQQMEVVDSVPVVRCKDCKHHYWVQEPCHGKSVHYCELPHMKGIEVFKEFFCYYGERKEGADNV